MTQEIHTIVDRDFSGEQRTLVLNELSSIGLNHVMAESEHNLENTRLAILKLAKGDLNQVIYLTEKAKTDFRDVMMWAFEQK
ncbi:MAG: hypothetical protein WAT19_04680 [Ferruginibacter sp.]